MATFLLLAIKFYSLLPCGSIRFDKLANFGADVNGLDIDDFTNGFGGKGSNVGRAGLRINEENVLSFDCTQPPYPAGKRLPANRDAVRFEQCQKLFEYSLLVHIEGIRPKQILKKERGTSRYN